MGKNYNGTECPHCKAGRMQAVGERKGGFSGGKAIVGAAIVDPIGLAAGALGKKKITYQCNNCGYTIES